MEITEELVVSKMKKEKNIRVRVLMIQKKELFEGDKVV